MAKPQLVIALSAAVLTLGACAGPTAEQLAEIERTSPSREQMERSRRIHGDSNGVARAEWLFSKNTQREQVDEVTGATPIDLAMVYLADDPRQPSRQRHVGWAREWRSPRSDRTYVRFHDLTWTPLAVLDGNGILTIERGSETMSFGRAMSNTEAAAAIWGPRGFFGVDATKYDKTTILRSMEGWDSAAPVDRGIRLDQAQPIVRVTSLVGDEALAALREMDKANADRRLVQDVTQLRTERAGTLSEADRAAVESVIKPVRTEPPVDAARIIRLED